MNTVLSSRSREVVVSIDRPFVVIGERINPTGRKKLAAEMVAGNFETVKSDALAQVAAGDETHRDAHEAMRGRWKRPISGLGWYRDVKREFAGRHETIGLFRVDLPAKAGAIQGFELTRIGWFRRDELPPRVSDLLDEILQRDQRLA